MSFLQRSKFRFYSQFHCHYFKDDSFYNFSSESLFNKIFTLPLLFLYSFLFLIFVNFFFSLVSVNFFSFIFVNSFLLFFKFHLFI